MDVNTITALISSVGFPIVACCYMGWLNYDQRRAHKQESDALTQALNNNTIIITELKTELETRWDMIKEEIEE